MNNNNNNNNIVQYSAAGYILIWRVASPHTTDYGYVLSQNAVTRELTVHLATNNVITVPGPFYNRVLNTFDFFHFYMMDMNRKFKRILLYIYSFPQEVICHLLCIDSDVLRI